MKKFLLIVLLFMGLLVGCEVVANPVVFQKSLGNVTSVYCRNGNLGFKTDQNVEGSVIRNNELVCPIIQLQTEAIMTRHKNGDCWVYFVGTGQTYKCY